MTQQKIIIGINGARGAGKDTVAGVLGSFWNFHRVAFADLLKHVISQIIPFDHDALYGDSKWRDNPLKSMPFTGICTRCHQKCVQMNTAEELLGEEGGLGLTWYCPQRGCERYYPKYLTPRLACESLGEEWGRTLHEDLWILATMRSITESQGDQFVITDVRYHREVAAIRAAGGHLIRLKRKWDAPRNGHRSDMEMLEMPDSDFDLVLPDAKSVDEHIPTLRGFVLPLRQAAGLRGTT